MHNTVFMSLEPCSNYIKEDVYIYFAIVFVKNIQMDSL